MTIDFLGIAYALIVAVGGIIGYVKAGSTPSLIAGVLFGAVIAVGAFLSSRDPPIFYLSLAVSIILGGFMGWRFYSSDWKFMPSGLIFIIRTSVFNGLQKYSTAARTNVPETTLPMPQVASDTRPRKKASEILDSIIRVDHAGEFGADRIYAGQMAILGKTKVGPKIKEMWEQEKHHRATFERLIQEKRVRPTALLPLWDVMGFALGAGSALLGEKGAMACTVAVETVIVNHYNDQLRALMNEKDVDPEILKVIKEFRDDEQEHHDTGIEYGAKEAPFYEALSNSIKTICKVAIEISKKV